MKERRKAKMKERNKVWCGNVKCGNTVPDRAVRKHKVRKSHSTETECEMVALPNSKILLFLDNLAGRLKLLLNNNIIPN